MTCPHCTADLPDDDLFCEECGRKLSEEQDPLPPLCACGAPEGDLDEDGYCLQCGRRCRPAPEEHQEKELWPQLAAVSDRGLKHARNEDRVEIASGPGRIVMVICDGVSNSAQAEAASTVASQSLGHSLLSGATLEAAFKAASDEVAKLAHGTAGKDNPSTTAVAAVIEGGHVQIGWLGDSRAYWIAGAESRQLTTDHSWLNDVVSSGELSYSEAAKLPQAHGITRWMGADVDPEQVSEIIAFEVPGPGTLLLCTDGLWNYTADTAALVDLVSSGDSQQTALEIARRLVAFANEKGGHDNITVALLQVNP